MSRLLAVGLTSTLAAIAGIASYLDLTPIRTLELQLRSNFFAWRGTVKPPEDIIILAIDDSSLRQGEFYDPVKRPHLEPFRHTPWKRIVYAQVIDKLMQAGAKAVAVDVLFTTPSAYGIEDDQALQDVLTKYQERVILAANFTDSQTTEAGIAQLETPADIFDVNPQSPAYVNFFTDVDNNVRSLPQGLPEGLPSILSFAEATLSSAKIDFPKPAGEMIYFYGTGETWLNYRQQIPFYYVVEPANWSSELLQNGKFFKDKIVLIGSTAPSQQDIQPSAVGRMPGVEIHANAIATLMNDLSIREGIKGDLERGIFVFLFIFLVCLGLSLIRRPLVQLATMLFAVLAWVGVAYICFIFARVALPAALPILGVTGGGVTLLTVGAIASQLEKLSFKRTLERYVAGPVVQQIINQPEDYRAMMAGKTIKAAVLFSDIRGFTTISSYLPPKELVAQLNEYLGRMVDVILEQQGTIDKFIGDAIMAEFGSPVSSGAKEDAMNAIRAALGMRRALSELRKIWKTQGKIPFANGIGINYGEFTVGNIGSPRRLEYAVIGDTVNVASRVEGMTKELGTDIAITDSLYQLVKDEVEVIDCGDRQLKGRVGAVHLYSLIGLKGQDHSLFQEVQSVLQDNNAMIEQLKLS